MSRRRITTADCRRNKRKRKHKIATITSIIVLLVILTIWALITSNIFGVKTGLGVEKVAIKELGVSNSIKKSYEDAIAVGSSNNGNNIDPNNNDDEMEYEVPETSLPPVEEVEGNNIYNEGIFAPSEKIAGRNHFDKSVFIGASRTEGLLIYSGVDNMNAFCYKGLSVDKTFTDKVISIPDVNGSYTVAEAVEMTYYDNYYIMFGINELGWVSVEIFINHYNDLIDAIYEVNPNAVIYIENIIPVSKSCSDIDSVYNMNNVNKFNDAIKEMVEQRGDCIYLDLASAVSDENGYLPEEGTVDGKHCNVNYCKRIIQYIRLNTFTKK